MSAGAGELAEWCEQPVHRDDLLEGHEGGLDRGPVRPLRRGECLDGSQGTITPLVPVPLLVVSSPSVAAIASDPATFVPTTRTASANRSIDSTL